MYFTLFFEFFKIGLFCFGGAFGMIPIIRDVILQYEWMTEAEFYSFVGLCESTPGPIAINLATYIGSIEGGFWGSLVAVIGVVLPSFIIILLISSILKNMTDNKYFKALVWGIKPIVTALILHTGLSFFLENIGISFQNGLNIDISSVVLFVLVVGVYFLFYFLRNKAISSVSLIIISAFLGIAVCMAEEYLFV